jgi:hypothetical protein
VWFEKAGTDLHNKGQDSSAWQFPRQLFKSLQGAFIENIAKS